MTTLTRWDVSTIILMVAVGWETGQLAGWWPGPADPRWPHLLIFVLLALVVAVSSRLLRR